MGEIFIFITSTVFLPMSLLLIFLEKRARRVILCFLCGILVCLSAYYFNNFIYHSGSISNKSFSIILAPLIEETLKLIPSLIFSFTLKKGKRQTIAMSFALGVGFCVVENLYYLFSNAHSVDVFWVIARCVGAGLMHPMSATLIGFGLYKGRIKNKVFVIGISAFIIAILYHGLYNLLVANSATQIIGILLPILSYISLFVFLKKDFIKSFFDDDIEDII